MTKGRSVPSAWRSSLTSRIPLRPVSLPTLPPLPLPPLLLENGVAGFVSSAPCISEAGRLSAGSCPSSSDTRRTLVLQMGCSLLFAISPALPISPSLAAPTLQAAEAEEAGRKEVLLVRYTDKEAGFTLLRPSTWLKVDKAGATVLFEGENNKSNSIGVVVNPVRLSSLKDFGTPQFVAEKLIQAERRKESTKDTQMVQVDERAGHRGLPVYEFEYTVDSSRGKYKGCTDGAG